MKQKEESYLDQLLEDISGDNGDTYTTSLNNDADSFQLNDDDLNDINLDDFSFDLEHDFGSMPDSELDNELNPTFDPELNPDLDVNLDTDSEPDFDDEQFQSFEDVSAENDFDEIDKEFEKFKQDAIESYGTSEQEEIATTDESGHKILDIPEDMMNDDKDDSPFEETLMESLLSESLNDTESDINTENIVNTEDAAENQDSTETEQAVKSTDESSVEHMATDTTEGAEISDNEMPELDDVIQQLNSDEEATSPKESEENTSNENKLDENYDPMSDVEDLLGLLSQEEEHPESVDEHMDSLDLSQEVPSESNPEDILTIPDIDVNPDMESAKASDDLLSDTSLESFLNPEVEESETKIKAGFFKRLFGNIHDEKARKQNEWKGPVDEDGNPIVKQKKSKEEIKALKDAKKKEKEEKKKEKAAIAADKKAQKDAVKQQKKEAKKEKQLQVVVEEDEGRINRVGASIVFVLFAIMGATIIIGTDSFSYSQSIQQATDYFGMQKYNSAYDEVRGIDVKDKDLEIYDKIMTVMFVNKQLNSYNNYYNMEMYPEALDSLLKGLQRYDEYISIAKELGIKSDLDYVRKQILAELNNIFGLDEQDCYNIIDSDNQESYSEKVIQAASNE